MRGCIFRVRTGREGPSGSSTAITRRNQCPRKPSWHSSNDIARDPDLQKEFVALGAKHDHDFSTDELNDTDLAAVSGGVANIFEPMAVRKKKKPAKK